MIRHARLRIPALFLMAAFVLAACGSGQVTVNAEEERWCRSDLVALSENAVGVAFERLHGIDLATAKAEFGYSAGAGEQVGSRMTITEPEGFPTVEARDAWYESDEWVRACRAAFDAYN